MLSLYTQYIKSIAITSVVTSNCDVCITFKTPEKLNITISQRKTLDRYQRSYKVYTCILEI